MPGTRVLSLPDCRPLLADADDLQLAFQPIVDLAGATVAGYEVLSRFPGTAGPDVWFAAAADAGVAPSSRRWPSTRRWPPYPACPTTHS
jgi:EAL domain-containing protein (putative c-di-GMP-specific phosphodiesterase class I)